MPTKKQETPTVAVSGGFDPLHAGHVRMIRAAADHGDVIVIANSDAWLIRKKGYTFMTFEERKEILSAIKGVKSVVEAEDDDNSVCMSLAKICPTYFANGGDRYADNTPELQICKKYGIELIWNVGGTKIQSSSELVENARENK